MSSMYVFTWKCGSPICHIYNSGGTQTCNFSDFFLLPDYGSWFDQKISVSISAFSGITGKADNPRFWKICFQEFSFHLIVLPEFPRFSVGWFAFRKFNNSWIFFLKILYHLPPFRKYLNFWSNRKHLIDYFTL